MQFRKVKTDEFRELSNIHISSFPGFFLTTLGKNFLNTYYRASLKNRKAIAVCAINSDNIMQGFSIGCTKQYGYHKQLIIKNLFPFLLQGLVLLLFRPKAFLRLLLNLDKNKKTDNGDYAELLSIAVLPELRGTGIGNELIRKFEEEAKLKGCNKIALTTDRYNNKDVIAFYKRNGYRMYYGFTTYPHRKMFKMIKELT